MIQSETALAGFKYIETEFFESTFQGLFSEIDLSSPKLGKKYEDRNAKLCTIIQKIAEGLAEFPADIDAAGDTYEYLIGQFAAGSGKKAGETERSGDIESSPQALPGNARVVDVMARGLGRVWTRRSSYGRPAAWG